MNSVTGPHLFKEHFREKTASQAMDFRDHVNELLINDPLTKFWRWNTSVITVVHKKSRGCGMAVYTKRKQRLVAGQGVLSHLGGYPWQCTRLTRGWVKA